MRQSFEEKVERQPLEPKSKSRLAAILIAAVALTVAAAAVSPFFFSRHEVDPDTGQVHRLIATHDLENLLPAIEQFDKGLREGVLYPRWFAGFNKGYGAATGNFYPPGIYYMASIINGAARDWVNTLFIISALGLALSGLALYLLARAFFGRLASAVAALLYMLAPYHMLDLYWRGAIPEFVGFAFMPIVLYFVYRLGSEGRLRYYAAAGLLYGAYLMTHFPIAYIFTYILALYGLIWAVRERDLRIAARVAGGMSIGIALAAIYLLPAALESKYVYEWASELFPYHQTYMTLMETDDVFNKKINNSFVFQAVALIISILILRPANRFNTDGAPETYRRAYTHIRIWVFLGVAAFFMCTSLSIYVSKLIPKIQVAVPTFRWMAIASVFMALLVAAAVERLRSMTNVPRWWQWGYRAALAGAIALNIWFSVQSVIIGALSNSTYIPRENRTDSGFTPKDSVHPEDLVDSPLVLIRSGRGTSEVLRWEPLYREVAVHADMPSLVRLKSYNFPGWTAVVNGQPAALISDGAGIQAVMVQPGTHRIQVAFTNTPPRTAGALVSGAGLLIIIGLAALDYLGRGGQLRRIKRPSSSDRSSEA